MSDNNSESMMKNLDTIKTISKLMSGENSSVDTDKIINALVTAKSLGIIGEERKDRLIETSEGKEYINGTDCDTENMRMVKAAIPFLDREYQKNLFLAVKLMEMSKEFDSEEMSLQCQSIREGNDEKQREYMLRAVRGQLSDKNGRRLDVILKMMEARRLAGAVKNIQ